MKKATLKDKGPFWSAMKKPKLAPALDIEKHINHPDAPYH